MRSLVRVMALTVKLVTLGASLTLLATPALALPSSGGNPSNPGGGHGANPSSNAPAPPSNAKAYGRYCKDQSRKHVKGEKGTPFSHCVTAMAKLASGATDSPREACKPLSRKHTQGEKGTPFSRCAAAGDELLSDLD